MDQFAESKKKIRAFKQSLLADSVQLLFLEQRMDTMQGLNFDIFLKFPHFLKS